MDRILLKNGKPHPELVCPESAHAIYFSRHTNKWHCSDVDTDDPCRWTSDVQRPY